MSDVQTIEIFDRKHLRRNRDKAAKASPDHLFLVDWADKQIAERLLDINRNFDVGVQIGARSDGELFTRNKKINTLYRCELSIPAARHEPHIVMDEEFLPFQKETLDIVLSTLSLHSVNDLPGALLQIRRALKKDGLFISAILGGETLHELRASLTQAELALKGGVSPRIFPFADKQQMGALLQRAGFALPVIDSEIITVTYDNIFKLMHDLRFMGEGNIIKERSKISPGKDFFMKAAQYYSEHFSEEDGRIKASFEIIFLLGWAPHDSQQKPLRPGSAKNKLADALNTDEIKTGEKATP